jgi:hypothetical protein
MDVVSLFFVRTGAVRLLYGHHNTADLNLIKAGTTIRHGKAAAWHFKRPLCHRQTEHWEFVAAVCPL